MPYYQEKNKSKWTKDGRSWYFRCYYTDVYGKRKQKDSRLYKTKSEAKNAEIDFLSKHNIKSENDLNIMFIDVYSEWFALKKRSVKSTTAYSYTKIFDKNILEFFKKFKLHAIKVNTINDWYEFLSSGTLTIEYQNKLINQLGSILSYAKDNYNFNPKVVSHIVAQRDESVKIENKTVVDNFWTIGEFEYFIGNVDDKLYNLYFRFLYFTGLRFGEFAALNWNDLDFERKTLRINKTLTNKTGKGTYEIFEPKTKNAKRVIDLDDNLISLLKDYYMSEKNIYNFSKDFFIFGNIKPISSTTFRRNLNAYIKKSKIKKITIHGFRHSHVSLLFYLGCDTRDVAERIGDTISVVERVYYHMYADKKSNTVLALNNLFLRGKQEVELLKLKKSIDIQCF